MYNCAKSALVPLEPKSSWGGILISHRKMDQGVPGTQIAQVGTGASGGTGVDGKVIRRDHCHVGGTGAAPGEGVEQVGICRVPESAPRTSRSSAFVARNSEVFGTKEIFPCSRR